MDDENMIEIPIRIKPEILFSYAFAVRNECRKQGKCANCTFYDKDEDYPVCVLMMRSPADWALEHISQLKEEGVKK